MQLTRAADYAVRVVMHLATLPEAEHVSRAELAEATGVPDSFLSKILQALSRAGLVGSRRGLDGGFALLPQGRQASLLDVVEAIEGPICLNLCLMSGTSCDNEGWCAAHLTWAKAQEAMSSVLRSAMITDLAAQSVERRRRLSSASGGKPVPAQAAANDHKNPKLDNHRKSKLKPGEANNA